MKFHVVTLFPEVVEAYIHASILGRALQDKKIAVKTYQIRNFVTNKWGKADERPYGGGPGMVLQAEPILRAVEKIKKGTARRALPGGKKKVLVLLTSPRGKPLTNTFAKSLTQQSDVVIVCGRYEGIDARIKKILKAREISTGPYILTGGEIPALAIIDATARQIPGVLGKFESLEESRVASRDVYTRPEVITHKGKKYRVPKILLSGDHGKIETWKKGPA